MSNILDIIKSKDKCIYAGNVTDNRIREAEMKLGLIFSDEYKEYVSCFGCVSFVSHELTGICSSENTNVVTSTIRCKESIPNIPSDWYVIEEANIDGIIIWQESSGIIHETQPKKTPRTIAGSLAEYIVSL